MVISENVTDIEKNNIQEFFGMGVGLVMVIVTVTVTCT